jgi:CDP-glucose 4,6-dehydratase
MEKVIKKILVTGGTGFIGSHLVEELLKYNYIIVIPYIKIEKKSLFATNPLFKRVIVERVNIKNKKKIIALVKKHNIDFIFHLAAETIVTSSLKNPYKTLETNIMGTINILETARLLPRIKGVIVASSDKAYGKSHKPYTETFPLRGSHPYDVSKSALDLICQAYIETYKTPVIIARFGNAYGEGDLHTDRVIPAICLAIATNKIVQLRSDGTYIRDYLYVKDVAKGYVMLMKKFEFTKGEAYNFSSHERLSVLDLIKQMEKILHTKIPYKITNSAVNEIPHQNLIDQKIRKLGWKNIYTLKKTIPSVYRWYLHYAKAS